MAHGTFGRCGVTHTAHCGTRYCGEVWCDKRYSGELCVPHKTHCDTRYRVSLSSSATAMAPLPVPELLLRPLSVFQSYLCRPSPCSRATSAAPLPVPELLLWPLTCYRATSAAPLPVPELQQAELINSGVGDWLSKLLALPSKPGMSFVPPVASQRLLRQASGSSRRAS